jgi:ParB family chromosome partitioning protein
MIVRKEKKEEQQEKEETPITTEASCDRDNGFTESPVVKVPIAEIRLDLFSPRQEFSDEHILELAESIRRNGLWNPVLIHKETMGCISGECRIAAAHRLGWKEIDAKVLDISKVEAFRLALETNIKQKELTEIEEALHISKLLKMTDWSQRRIARELGKPEIYVRDRLKLLDLIPEVQDMIVRGILAYSHGIEIAKATSKDLQMILANIIVRDKISTGKATEDLVNSLLDICDSNVKKGIEEHQIFEAIQQLPREDLEEIQREHKLGLYVDIGHRAKMARRETVTVFYSTDQPEIRKMIDFAREKKLDLNELWEKVLENGIREYEESQQNSNHRKVSP